MKKEFVYKEAEIDDVAAKFLKEGAGHRIFAFSGQLGAGKTTFISALCKQLKAKERVTSPTYSIIQEYEATDGTVIFHMDWYRIKDEEEAIQAGVEDCLLSGHFCFIEWPGKASELLPEQTIYSIFNIIDSERRKLTVTLPE